MTKRFGSAGLGGLSWCGCTGSRRKSCGGACPTLENSTACQKSMPMFCCWSGWFLVWGAGRVDDVFLWLIFMIKSSGLGSVSAGISYPSGFVFLAALWVVGLRHLRRV